MTKSRTSSNQESAKISSLTVKKDFFEEQLKSRILIGDQLFNRIIQTAPEIETLRDDYYDWNDYNNELLKVSFDNPENEYRKSYATATEKYIYIPFNTPQDELNDLKNDIKIKKTNLERLISKLPLINSKIIESNLPIHNNREKHSENKKIFIVHGQNNEKKLETFNLLKALELEPIILHEQPNGGRTIIEKFEEYSDVGYAIILLTDDDEGKSKKEDDYKLRARQNVILELGFFIGKLGRSRVCALYIDKVDLPNDISGLVYIPLDSSGAWKFALAKELKSAGYNINANNLL